VNAVFYATGPLTKAEVPLLEMSTLKLLFLEADSAYVAKADTFPDYS
jgi:hypothetical protein